VIIRDVSPGVHAIVHGHTNCFVIEDDDGITLVDAAYSSTWRQVEECLAKMNRSPADIGGLLLTHGHFDHLGFASLIQRQYTVPVWAHPADSAICKHPYSYQPGRPRLLYPVAYPRSVPILASMVVAGALLVPGVVPDHALVDGSVLPLPGHPQVISTPGHTDGACVFWLPDREALITGDSLVTLDPYSGRRGPRMVGRAGTKDARRAIESAQTLASIDARHVLPGHGEMWNYGVAAAVVAASGAL